MEALMQCNGDGAQASREAIFRAASAVLREGADMGRYVWSRAIDGVFLTYKPSASAEASRLTEFERFAEGLRQALPSATVHRIPHQRFLLLVQDRAPPNLRLALALTRLACCTLLAAALLLLLALAALRALL